LDGDVEKGVLGESIYRSLFRKVHRYVFSLSEIIAESFHSWKVLFLCFENQPDGGLFGVLGWRVWGLLMEVIGSIMRVNLLDKRAEEKEGEGIYCEMGRWWGGRRGGTRNRKMNWRIEKERWMSSWNYVRRWASSDEKIEKRKWRRDV